MTPEAYERTREILEAEEGRRAKPYLDTEGHLTIGVGHNLERGIPDDIIDLLLERDVDEAIAGAEGLPGYKAADPVRQSVLVRMVFQLGLHGVLAFKRMLTHFAAGAYEAAAAEMMDSQWARQTPARARREAEIMRTGRFL